MLQNLMEESRSGIEPQRFAWPGAWVDAMIIFEPFSIIEGASEEINNNPWLTSPHQSLNFSSLTINFSFIKSRMFVFIVCRLILNTDQNFSLDRKNTPLNS